MKKNLFIILTAVLVLSALTSCTTDPKDTVSKIEDTSGVTDTGTTDESNANADTTAQTEAKIPTFEVGDKIAYGNFEITLNSVSFESEIKSSQYTSFKPDEGNKYAVVNLTVKNVGKEADTFYPSFDLTDTTKISIKCNDEYTYSATNLLGFSDDLHDKHLNPLASFTGILAFEIPEGVIVSDDTLVLELNDNDKQAIFKLK